MKLLTTYSKIPWKMVIGLNALILTFGGAILAQQAISRPTHTASKAAPIESTPTPPPNYPKNPPEITDLELFYAKPNDAVRIRGHNFGDYQWQSQVYLYNQLLNPIYIQQWSDTAIDITVPQDSASGQVSIIVNGNTTQSPYPLIISNNPTDTSLYLQNQTLFIKNQPQNAILTLGLQNNASPSGVLNNGQRLSELVYVWQFTSNEPTTLLKLNNTDQIKYAKLELNYNLLPLTLNPF